MRILSLAVLLPLAGACTEPASTGGAASGAGGEAAPRAPSVAVRLTDAPGDFDEVWVNIASVEIESAEQGWITLTDAPQAFDLLTLQHDVTAALGGGELAPGSYGQLRLIVDDAHVVTEGVSEDLRIASGAQTGIKINLGATFEENMQYTLVIDFDAAKSVKSTGQGWLMTPVIQVKELTGEPLPQDEDEPTEDGTETGGEGGETPVS